MFRLTLQLSQFSTVDIVFFASDLLTGFIGIVVGYIAYKSYRGTEERPMLFVAAGFMLVFLVPTVLSVIGISGLLTDMIVIGSLTQVSELCGVVSILYGLRMPVRDEI